MLNFRNANLILLLLLMLMGVLYDHSPFSRAYFILPFLAWSLLVFYGCYFIHSGFFIRIKCKEETREKLMALTFDDGPDEKNTKVILDILKKTESTATFFCIGRNIPGNESILKRIQTEGHTIGNHSYAHAFLFDLFPKKKMQKDLEKMDNLVFQILGKRPKLFRPPYGVTNPAVRDVILRGNYFPVGWSVRSMDTVAKEKSKFLDKIFRSFEPGAVLLFHDTSSITLQSLEEVILAGQQKGFRFVSVDRLFQIEAYA